MAIWTPEELNGLKNNIVDGVTVAEMESIVESRKATAIIKKAQQLNYGVKTIDGVQCFYSGIKSRNRRTKAEIGEVSSEKITIIGESRVAGTTQESISERTKQNASDDIVAKKDTGVAKTELSSIYDDVTSLFSNSNYSLLQSITVAFSNVTMTITKDSL